MLRSAISGRKCKTRSTSEVGAARWKHTAVWDWVSLAIVGSIRAELAEATVATSVSRLAERDEWTLLGYHDYFSLMLIDLHCHTRYSHDNNLDPQAFVTLAKQRGLDAVCVTEHNSVEASAPVVKLGRQEGLLVLQAVEVTTDRGHILCYGLEDDSWQRLRRTYWTRFEDLEAYASEHAAVLVPAHPFRQWSRNSVGSEIYFLERIAALEMVNGCNGPDENAAASEAAAQLGLCGTGGSDSHYEDDVASTATHFESEIATIRELAGALLAETFYPMIRGRDGVWTRYNGVHPDPRR